MIIYRFSKQNAPFDSLTHQDLNLNHSTNTGRLHIQGTKYCKVLEAHLPPALKGHLRSKKENNRCQNKDTGSCMSLEKKGKYLAKGMREGSSVKNKTIYPNLLVGMQNKIHTGKQFGRFPQN